MCLTRYAGHQHPKNRGYYHTARQSMMQRGLQVSSTSSHTKTTDDGYNGTFTTRYNFPWGPNVNLTTTLKQGKFGASVFVGTGKQLPTQNLNQSSF